MFPAEDGRGEAAKEGYTSPSVLFQEEWGFWCQACSSATVVDRGTRASLPAVLGLVAIKFPSSPFALGPGGETVRNELETYACNSGCVLRGQETVGSRLHSSPLPASLEESAGWISPRYICAASHCTAEQ